MPLKKQASTVIFSCQIHHKIFIINYITCFGKINKSFDNYNHITYSKTSNRRLKMIEVEIQDYNDHQEFVETNTSPSIERCSVSYDGGRLSIYVNGIEVISTTVSNDFGVSFTKKG